MEAAQHSQYNFVQIFPIIVLQIGEKTKRREKDSKSLFISKITVIQQNDEMPKGQVKYISLPAQSAKGDIVIMHKRKDTTGTERVQS